MSRSKHNGCGRTCGLCRPWKKWKSNSAKDQRPSVQKALQIDKTPARLDADRTAKPKTEIVEVHERKEGGHWQTLFEGCGQEYIFRPTGVYEAKGKVSEDYRAGYSQGYRDGCVDTEEAGLEEDQCRECKGIGWTDLSIYSKRGMCQACQGTGERT